MSGADEQADPADLAAMRRGQLPAGWVYGLNDKHQEAFDEQRRILLESARDLYRGPVYGPDGIAVAIWYEGTDEYREVVPAPATPRSGSRSAYFLALLDHWLSFTGPRQYSYVVQAHAMSGQPAAIMLRFLRKQDAHNFAAELARRVRASGVEALWQDGWPKPAGRD
ncbi:MAG TPA: hypothetical protein VN969_37935 [Streptosporangiaceae bacterium]|nr:hypothetical protein [Streptosporangiaceae bacterium]